MFNEYVELELEASRSWEVGHAVMDKYTHAMDDPTNQPSIEDKRLV